MLPIELVELITSYCDLITTNTIRIIFPSIMPTLDLDNFRVSNSHFNIGKYMYICKKDVSIVKIKEEVYSKMHLMKISTDPDFIGSPQWHLGSRYLINENTMTYKLFPKDIYWDTNNNAYMDGYKLIMDDKNVVTFPHKDIKCIGHNKGEWSYIRISEPNIIYSQNGSVHREYKCPILMSMGYIVGNGFIIDFYTEIKVESSTPLAIYPDELSPYIIWYIDDNYILWLYKNGKSLRVLNLLEVKS